MLIGAALNCKICAKTKSKLTLCQYMTDDGEVCRRPCASKKWETWGGRCPKYFNATALHCDSALFLSGAFYPHFLAGTNKFFM